MGSLKNHGSHKKQRYTYECPGKKSKSCNTKGINAKYLENSVLDLIVSIINSSNISKELKKECDSRIKYLNGVNGKNKSLLISKQNSLDALAIKSIDSSNPSIKQAFDKQIERLALEILDYENKICEISNEIERLQKNSIETKITKDELLSNRAVARNIIKQIVKSIEVDEENDDINIELY